MTELEVLAPRVQSPIDGVPFHESKFPDGTTFSSGYRTKEGYLLRYHDLDDFEIKADGSHVTCTPAPDVPWHTSEHLYLNQVLPLILYKNGKLVLHGSAVDIGGIAVAFLAETGRGKSTLAASFAVDGCPFLTDDGLLIETHGVVHKVMPGHPWIRLWEDSHDALLPPDARTAPPVHFTTKARFVAGSNLGFCDRPRQLKIVYFLGKGEAADVQIRRLEPGQAVAAAMEHSFILDAEDRPALSAHFDRLVKLAGKVACFHLDYPRLYDDLSRVMQAIRSHAAIEGSGL